MLRTLLIIEDQHDLAQLVALHLADLAQRVHICGDGTEALRLAAADPPDLVVLDLGLPGLDGLEVCRRLRALPRYVPILMLTARSSDAERVLGLELGADDYVVKPFNVMELVARAKAIVRRMQAQATDTESAVVRCGALHIDPAARRVTLNGAEIALTAREFDLLLHFARHPGRVFTREQLLDTVWAGAHGGYAHTVNSHINRLRAKIERDAAAPYWIQTVWGVGYRFATDQPADA
jgi:DNA-binding response OmpR family regulator